MRFVRFVIGGDNLGSNNLFKVQAESFQNAMPVASFSFSPHRTSLELTTVHDAHAHVHLRAHVWFTVYKL